MFEFLRKDLLLLAMIVAVFLSLAYAIGYVSDRSPTVTELEPNFLKGEHAPRNQTAAGRVWREHAFERLVTISSPALANPMLIRADNVGNIYVLDWADFKVKMFSPEGKLLKAFGEGKGTGASTFVNPTAFSIRHSGELWVCDPLQRKLTRFNSDGEAQAVAAQGEVYRIAVVGDLLVTMPPPGGDTLFKVYNSSGEQVKSFGKLIEDQAEKGIVLDGNIVGDDESDGFVYGGRYLGVIAGYDVDGAQRFVVRTIDVPPPPKMLDIGGKQKIKPNSVPVVLSLSIVGDKLYVLSGTSTSPQSVQSTSGQVMDVYDKRDGSYLFSLSLPMACREAVVQADHIYALGEGGVTAWRFAQSD